MYAGVDYGDILAAAQAEADVVIWDGGNNDFPFFRPDLMITVADPLRPGHELNYHPGEANLRMSDVIVINKVDSAEPADIKLVERNATDVNPRATLVFAESPVDLEPGPDLAGKRVLVIDDGPTITHGNMPFGAGMVAARAAGAAEFVDARPYAVGSIAATYRKYPAIGNVLPAMGYGDEQLAELAQTIDASDAEIVVTGTPMDLGRLITVHQPIRHATYRLREVGTPTIEDVLAPIIARARTPILAGKH